MLLKETSYKELTIPGIHTEVNILYYDSNTSKLVERCDLPVESVDNVM